MSKKLLKSGAIFSAMTFISRVLGLVRDIVIANLMGAGAAADVFLFANKIPNFLRRLFAEGAFAQAFVPVLSEYREKEGEEEVRKLIAAVSGTLGTIVTVVTILGVLGSSVVVALFGFGWFKDWLYDGPSAEKFELASLLLKITFPYLWFIVFVAISGAVLNTLGKFAAAAFTPVFLNVAMIGAALYISPGLEQPEIGLAIGVFLGGLLQFLFQLPFLKSAGVLVKPSWDWSHPGVLKIRTLMIPALFGVSVYQINALLDTLIASFLQTGSISWLYYSSRLFEFPLGLFAVAISTVILPSLSALHTNASKERFSATLDWGVRFVCLLGIPAMVGLILLAKPMLTVLFMNGAAFTEQDVVLASASLIAYGSALISAMLIKVLATGYFSRQDTKTPVKIGIIAMGSNTIVSIILAIPFGYVGLAIATSMSATLNMILLWRGLAKQGVYRVSRQSLVFIARLLLAVLAMGALLVWLSPAFEQWVSMSKTESMIWLAGLIGAGALIFVTVNLALGLRIKDLKASESRMA